MRENPDEYHVRNRFFAIPDYAVSAFTVSENPGNEHKLPATDNVINLSNFRTFLCPNFQHSCELATDI